MKLPSLTQEPRFWLILPAFVIYFPLAFLFSPWPIAVGAIGLHLIAWLAIRLILGRARRARSNAEAAAS